MPLGSAYLVCTTERSGSGLLCSALWSTNLAGRPDEFFGRATKAEYMQRWNVRGYQDYIDRAIAYGSTPNGVFGAKVHAVHLSHIEKSLTGAGLDPQDASIETILKRLPPAKFIWLRRRDKVRQAISRWKARQTRAYTRRTHTETPRPTLKFDRRTIDGHVRSLESEDGIWAAFLRERGIRPLQLTYEDDLEHNWKNTTIRILRYLDIDCPGDLKITSDFQKQSDAHSELMYALYHSRNSADLT